MREQVNNGASEAGALASAAQSDGAEVLSGGFATFSAPRKHAAALPAVTNDVALAVSDSASPQASTSIAPEVWSRGAAAVDRHYVSGQFEVIFGDEVSTGTVLSSGAAAYDYGHTSGTVISSGGHEIVSRHAVASASVISGGGVEWVQRKGVTIDDVVESGGKEVLLGGHASGAAIHSGGALIISSGGSTTGAALSGGDEVVSSGGTASGSVISGGLEEVLSGGVAAAARISGGTLEVFSGGSVSGGLTLQAGEAIISGTAASGQTLSFTAGASAVLVLDNLSGFQASIAGLQTSGQQVDLGGFAFSAAETVSWTQSGTSGTLTVHDGAKTASLTLVGFYESSDFHLASDGRGGTLLSDPPTAGTTADFRPAAAARFAEVMAGLPGGRAAASYAVVHSGGSSLVDVSPLAPAATLSR